MRVKLGVVADCHVRPAGSRAERTFHAEFDFTGVRDRLLAALTILGGEAIDLLVLAGDLVDVGDRETADELLGCVAQSCNNPVLLVNGNHDPGVEEMRESACRVGLTLVEAPLPGNALEIRTVLTEARNGGWIGRLSPSEPSDAAYLRLVVSHFPLISRETHFRSLGIQYAGDLDNLGQLRAELGIQPCPSLILSAHLHRTDVFHGGDLLQVCVPPLIEAPFCVSLLELEVGEGEASVQHDTIQTSGAVTTDGGCHGWARGTGWTPTGSAPPHATQGHPEILA